MIRDLKVLWTSAVLVAVVTVTQGLSHAVASESEVPLKTLREQIVTRSSRVQEFRFIAEEARKLGARVWLFGGTAASYAHYVNWDLKRENGDTRYQSDRFDYDYTNIFRSTQDLDIVIDGTADQAQALERNLKEKFPHLQGNKSAWEVRLLRSSIGDKEALLDNPDFLNQHSDSNSTGMIELSESNEPRVRDIRDWENAVDPIFLRDVQSGTLHYYFSDLHKTTSRFLAGKNPEILSAIRYFTKAFQYELKVPDESRANLGRVIQSFDPKRDLVNPYASAWIEKNGAKLMQNAVNVEYAREVLDAIGLRPKLVATSSPDRVEAMGWWLNKEPLRSFDMGSGNGKTAREFAKNRGIAWDDFIVAHETNNFLAYESITRAHTGDANVFASRVGVVGETAAHGRGFYTQIGRKGARGTGITIRFRVEPGAREGTDFIVKNDYLIFRNRNALRVISESLNYGPVEYFRMLAGGLKFDATERGIAYRLDRRVRARLSSLVTAESDAIARIVKERFEEIRKDVIAGYPSEMTTGATITLAREWFSLSVSSNYPEITDTLFETLQVATPNGSPIIPYDSKGFFLMNALLPLFKKEHPEYARAAGLFWKVSRELHPETWGWEERYRAIQTTDLVLHPDAPKGLSIWIHNERKNSRVAAHFFSSDKWRQIPNADELFRQFLQTITKGDDNDLFHVLLRLLERDHSDFPGFDHAALRATILQRALKCPSHGDGRGLAIAYFVKSGAFHVDPDARAFMFDQISSAVSNASAGERLRVALLESDLWDSAEGISLIQKFFAKRPLKIFEAVKGNPLLLDHAAFVRYARAEAVYYGPEIIFQYSQIPDTQREVIFQSPSRRLDFLKILIHAVEYGPKAKKRKKDEYLSTYRRMLKEEIERLLSRQDLRSDTWVIANCGANPSFETLYTTLKTRTWSKELPGGSIAGLGNVTVEPKTLIGSIEKACAKLLRRIGKAARYPGSVQTESPMEQRSFTEEIQRRLRRIQEFEVIRKWGLENGVRIWIAGGTADGIATYLREELRNKDVPFPYTYYDVYRSTQDADIVIDASNEKAIELERYIDKHLKYLEGSKQIWEVRLLKEARGSGVERKDALIGETDFIRQNTDSYSTGMIELTGPPSDEAVIRDIFEWNRQQTTFLSDLLGGKVTFYRNPLHKETERFKSGYNPEIISAIRAYTKSFQYDAEIREESLVEIRKIVDEFQPDAWLSSDAIRYIYKNAFKLFQHARDVERAWNELEASGLRKKLVTFARKNGLKDLAALLEREPLRSFELGTLPAVTDPYRWYKPTFKTAAELGIKEVSHETNDFLAYENITMSRAGKANLFISRAGVKDETAAYGNGTYTKIGKIGARGTGLTVRYKVDPKALEGRDFYLAGRDYVVFRNANALYTIPEDRVTLTFTEYFNLLRNGHFSENDRGVMKKLELKARSNLSISESEIQREYELLVDDLKKSNVIFHSFRAEAALSFFMKSPVDAAKKEVLMDLVLSHRNYKTYEKLILLFEYGMEKMFLERQKNPEFLKLFKGLSEGNFGHGLWFTNEAFLAENIFKLRGASEEVKNKVADYIYWQIYSTQRYPDESKAKYYLGPAIAIYFDTAEVIPEKFTGIIALLDDSPQKARWLKKVSQVRERGFKCPELLKFRTWFPTN